jgi:hypothetical protein
LLKQLNVLVSPSLIFHRHTIASSIRTLTFAKDIIDENPTPSRHRASIAIITRALSKLSTSGLTTTYQLACVVRSRFLNTYTVYRASRQHLKSKIILIKENKSFYKKDSKIIFVRNQLPCGWRDRLYCLFNVDMEIPSI